uniref:Galectin n=1 Tax=Timema douglasi TaxID=61478 RepID=A0A7R8VZD9_TIMDO|nr:unnamed protein product [Timema douglasi]
MKLTPRNNGPLVFCVQPIPFLSELPVTLSKGRTITIHGDIFPDAVRMSLNLVCGSHMDSDLALHLNPRFDQNYVVRNCRVANHWGQEEAAAHRKNPLHRGKKFALTVFVAEEQFLFLLVPTTAAVIDTLDFVSTGFGGRPALLRFHVPGAFAAGGDVSGARRP